MSEGEDINLIARGSGTGGQESETGSNIVHLDRVRQKQAQNTPASKAQTVVAFNRRELDQILRIYGFKVASGEWRDYAIDMLKDRAIFSIFRRASEIPLHCIEKNPSFARKQGMWSVTGADGRVLKRGHELENILKIFEKSSRLKTF